MAKFIIKSAKEKYLLTVDIISMPHKLGLTVVAEGVENEEQRKRALNMLWEILHNILSALFLLS